MAGGTLTITVPAYPMLKHVAQRVSCWAGGVASINSRLIRVNSWAPAIVIPEELSPLGALLLEPGGVNLWSGYVPGTHVIVAAGNGLAAYRNPNTCAADPAQTPTISTIATNVGGNPLQITLNYANFAAAGTVDISWGDGTVNNAAAESGAINHTYPFRGAVYTIRVADTTAPTNFIEMMVYLP